MLPGSVGDIEVFLNNAIFEDFWGNAEKLELNELNWGENRSRDLRRLEHTPVLTATYSRQYSLF